MQTMGIAKQHVVYYQLQAPEREVIYIPMHHIGTKIFYDRVRKLVQKYQSEGYMVYYESIAYQLTDSLTRDQYDRKYRYLTGAHPAFQKALTADSSASQKQDSVRNYLGKPGIIYQPSYKQLGVFLPKAYRADIPKTALIDAFERTYGTISLPACDSLTALSEAYSCDGAPAKVRKIFDQQFVMALRDAHLAQQILELKEPKVLIIYGKAHYKNFVKLLKQQDANWVQKQLLSKN